MANKTQSKIDLNQFEAPEYMISKINSLIRERMNFVLRQYNLKLVEWRMLQVLDESEVPLTINELAELCVVERTVASKIIDAMIKRDLIGKRPLETDRRHSLVFATKMGKRIYVESYDSTLRMRERIFQDFSEEEIGALLELLGRMYMNTERMVSA